MASVAAIMRYPVKGLNGQALDSVSLQPGEAIPGDRAFAIRHGETVFDPAAPVHLSKTKFLALMTHAKLAALRPSFDDTGRHMTLTHGGEVVYAGWLDRADDAARLEAFLMDFIGDEAKGALKLVTAAGHMFSDVPEKCLSVLNLASVRALSDEVGEELDPLRFRANIHLEDLPAWAEREWEAGSSFTIGGVRFSLMKPIVRCHATNVNLETAEYDQNLPKTLAKRFGANLMGVYGVVETGGTIRPGDRLSWP
ncbi:MOSC domain-containing protein [Kordiimonas marina]|uniref:MOSC domain-containing protein n=1 Tax=Kordiimonas marina TaxID=2872312 RepID=UPI001FF5CA05|nr:MOSC domain-containing protein [Kordiimonas marina]MCJ9427933.1 MOSC domain-containing protein [Kordiimonas marina]